MRPPTINDYLDQVAFRAEEAKGDFERAVKSLNSTQAAKGVLRSGATITKTLRLLADDFDKLTNELLAYLAKALSRTELNRTELLSHTGQILQSYRSAFISIIRVDRLRSFAPSKGVDNVIEDALTAIDQRLTLRIREFAFGLDDHTAGTASEGATVTNNINIGTNLGNVQQGTGNSSQTLTVTLNASAINAALEMFELALARLPERERASMLPDLIALRAQASKPSLADGVIREIGRSLRGIAEGVAGNLATPAFLSACAALWSAIGIG